jgi:biotin carboxyl carrier protein
MRSFRITVDGTPYEVTVEELETNSAAPAAAAPSAPRPEMTTPVIAHAATGHPPPAASSAAPAVAAQPGDVASPLAGTVVKVEVAVGDKVTQGQPVLVLEAMKMNTSVTAPRDGSVSAIAVTAGTSVGEGQVLMTIA